MRRLPFPALLVALAACDQPSAAPAASASAAPPPAPPTVNVEGAASPDLDVASLQKALRCASDARSGACGVLGKMATCAPWNPIVPSGDGRWLGRGWLVEGAKTSEQVIVVRARRVPTTEVASGQLAVRIAVADLPKDEGAAFEQAGVAIRAFERNDVPPKSNATLDYLRRRTQWTEAFAVRTAGGQVDALEQDGTYICQGPGRTIVLVQRGAARGQSIDGVYAELWATAW